MSNLRLKQIAASIALALSSTASQAVLERVGPNNPAPSVGGFPAWYQDTTGITLEFCDPKDAAELAGTHCLLGTADVPVAPEVFPTSFFDEHFYYAAGALLTTPAGSKASLVLAEEAVAPNAPALGGEAVFSRIRVKLTAVPVAGTYRFIHPYGEEVLDGAAGGVIFFTDDVGINCAAGVYDCSLGSRLGPFLLPSATPGGLELAAVPGPVAGKLYIADPGRVGPVTGSTLPNFIDSQGVSRNHNIFRIEGPSGSNLGGPGIDFIETTGFSLMGRLYTGAIPGRVDVDRASYTRNATGTKVDVFATAFPTTSGRLPAQPRPAAVAPQMSFFAAPCAGTVDAAGVVRPPYSAPPLGSVETPMLADRGSHWGQAQPAVLPTAVCVQDLSATDAAGIVVPLFTPHGVTDEVVISQAAYDSAALSLTIAARSSDETAPPILSANFGIFRGDLVNGQLVLPNLAVPPANVKVLSSAQGTSQLAVTTNFAAAPVPPVIPVAADDAFTMLEDAGAQSLAVLANDTNVVGATVTVTSPPLLGTATANADGTVTYTPRLNANGTDGFSYTVTLGAQVSNIGNVALTVTPVNDPPVARNDNASTLVNTAVSINVLANDTDVEGAADIVAAVNLTPPAAGATASVAGGVVSFNATAAGTYSFTYQAQDVALATSAPATVTVTVTAQPPVVVADTVNIGRVEYVVSKNNLQVQGTVSPAVVESITLSFVNAAGTVLGAAGSTLTDTRGQWQLNQAVALPVGATAIKAVSAKGGTRTLGISFK